MKTIVYDKCPACGQMMEKPNSGWHTCIKCGTLGCNECLPAGPGTLCLDCELVGDIPDLAGRTS